MAGTSRRTMFRSHAAWALTKHAHAAIGNNDAMSKHAHRWLPKVIGTISTIFKPSNGLFIMHQ
jgi:hypothetical protein